MKKAHLPAKAGFRMPQAALTSFLVLAAYTNVRLTPRNEFILSLSKEVPCIWTFLISLAGSFLRNVFLAVGVARDLGIYAAEPC